MFFGKQKEIDRLNARCVELTRLLRDADLIIKEIDEIKNDYESNCIKILNVSDNRFNILMEIKEILTTNSYNNEKLVLEKINRLVNQAIDLKPASKSSYKKTMFR